MSGDKFAHYRSARLGDAEDIPSVKDGGDGEEESGEDEDSDSHGGGE
jgi:hypothetical protein